MYPGAPDECGAKKLETEEFPLDGLFVSPPPGSNTLDRRSAAVLAAHKDAQCLSVPVPCQNTCPPEKYLL